MQNFLTYLANALAPQQGPVINKPFGWNLQNAWPKMITNGTKALPSPSSVTSAVAKSNLPAVIKNTLPAAVEATAPKAAAAVGSGILSDLTGPGGMLLSSTSPANDGEVPFYNKDGTPNRAAAANMPAGSYGFGGGYQPQPPAPSPGVPTDAFGSTVPRAAVPLPRPRPPALQAAMSLAANPTASAPPAPPVNMQPPPGLFAGAPSAMGASPGGSYTPQPSADPGLITRFIQALKSGALAQQGGSSQNAIY